MGILFTAPQYEFEVIRQEWLDAVTQIGQQGIFVGGAPVSKFESAFAASMNVQGAVGVGNGTEALFLAMKALGIGKGDEVITVVNTFVATVSAIHHTGSTPVLVDCDDNFLIDIEHMKAAVTPRTKAIIPVHLYGQMVDMPAILSWAEERGIAVIEDCAQATGASIYGRPAGSWGTIGCYSFYPDKNLGALGDGGAITSSDPALLMKLRKLRNHGGEVRYQHDIPGFNSRLDPIQACALQIKLRFLEQWNAKRREIASWYQAELEGIDALRLPKLVHTDELSHVFHIYVVCIKDGRRDALKKHLQKKGILTGVQYPAPVHLLPAYQYLGYEAGHFPKGEIFAGEILSLPMHAALTEQEVTFISGEIRSFFSA